MFLYLPFIIIKLRIIYIIKKEGGIALMSEDYITQEEKDIMRIMQDPVLWTETHLNRKPRWYQQQALRHPHNRIALRWGRRLGKCIGEGSLVVDGNTGKRISVEDLYKNGTVETFSLDNQYKLSKEGMFHVEQNGVKPVYRISTSYGHVIELTENHPLLKIEGWTEVRDLKVGDSIATPQIIPVFGKETPTPQLARLTAYLPFAFTQRKDAKSIDITVKETKEKILEEIRGAGISLFPKTQQAYYLIDKENKYKDLLIEQERIPEQVFEYNQESLKYYIAAVYDIRGFISDKTKMEISLVVRSKELIQDLKHLLLRFGIHAYARTSKAKKDKYERQQLIITRQEDVKQFIKEFGNYGYRDYSSMWKKVKNMSEYEESLPVEIHSIIEAKLEEKNMLKRDAYKGINKGQIKRDRRLPSRFMPLIAENMQDAELYDIAHSDILWDEIKEIELVGEKMTYDIMMPKYHNLVVNDICVHNTWTMTAHILWAAFTNLGGTNPRGRTRCLIATPYDTQASMIFNELRTAIEENEMLKDSVKRMKQSPYLIELKNGGEIVLFTTGAKTSSAAASIRGQRADYIYMDEMD